MITKEYQEQLVIEHGDRKWGSSAIRFGGPDVLGLIMQRSYINSVLDFGCGKGLMGEFVKKHAPHVRWVDYDPGIAGKDTLPDEQFDLVISCDVLEHVEPEHIDDTIIQIADRTKFVLYNNIACAPANSTFGSGPYQGENIHLIIEEPSWWKKKFEVITDPKIELWEYRHCERRHKGGYRLRCTLIHERGG